MLYSTLLYNHWCYITIGYITCYITCYIDTELANHIAWDAVGAQFKPYLANIRNGKRPCGVALGCRSLNSCGIKMLLQAAALYTTRPCYITTCYITCYITCYLPPCCITYNMVI